MFKKISESKVQVKPGGELEIINLTTEKLLIITNVPFLMLSKIFEELKSLKGPYLELKAKNLYVDAKKLNLSTIEDEFKFLIDAKNVDRIIVDLNDIQENIFNIFNAIKVTTFFVVTKELCLQFPREMSDVKLLEYDFNLKCLDVESRNFFLEKLINFQNRKLKFSQIINSIDSGSQKNVP